MKSIVVVLIATLLLACCALAQDAVVGNVEITECNNETCGRSCQTNCGNSCETNCGSSCETNTCNCQPRCSQKCIARCQSCSYRGSKCNANEQVVILPPAAVPPSISSHYLEPTRTSEAHASNTTNSNSVQNNVTTTFELTSVVSNNNTIHIPVSQSYNHHTDIHITPAQQPSISINISNPNPTPTVIQQTPPIIHYVPPVTQKPPPAKEIEYVTIPSKQQEIHEKNCCTIVSPKECKYEKNGQINCTEPVHKVCGSMCTSPLIMQHTHPTYIPVPVDRIQHVRVPQPVPVYVPVPQIQRVPVPHPVPVDRIQQVPVPQPVPVYYPVPQIQRVPVPQPVPQYIPYVQRVPVSIPCQQQPIINLHGPKVVQQPSLCQVQSQQQIHYPTPQAPVIEYNQQQWLKQDQQQWLKLQQQWLEQQQLQEKHVQIQQIPQGQSGCVTSTWNGKQFPICKTVEDTQQFIGTDERFILDQWNAGGMGQVQSNCQVIGQYPWIRCNKQSLKDCHNCVYCDGTYNPQKCMLSQNCNSECRTAMSELNLPKQMGRLLDCKIINAAVKCT